MQRRIKKSRIALLCILLGSALAIPYTLITLLLDSKEESQMEIEAATDESSYVIVLDAGHGGYDTGGISMDMVYEKDITLSIALKTGEILSENGYQVLYTRTSDEVSWSNDNLEDLQSRIAIAEQANADYYISIHTNASEYNDGASGFEAYIHHSDDTMLAMAQSIEKNLMDLQYTTSRGIKRTDESSLYVIDQNPVAAILLEVGFLTDEQDAAYLCSEEGQQEIAEAIAEGIMENL